MKSALRLIIHILSYPALLAIVLIANLDVIKDQFHNYSYWTLIGLVITIVMALLFYLVYFIVTNNKSKLSKFAQTCIVSVTAIATLGGTWVACDKLLPDIISDATSSTIFYEDLAEDSWKERADINAQLINEFIEMNVRARVLPEVNGKTTEEAIEYYQKLGVDNEIPEIKDIEKMEGIEYPFHTINELLAIQYESINANGYESFTSPWIGFATGSRLTIPCLLHLLLDKRDVDPDDLADLDSPTVVYHEEDDKIVIDEVMLAVYDPDTGYATCKPLAWSVLDMLGTYQTFDVGSLLENETVKPILDMVETLTETSGGIAGLLTPVTNGLSYILADEDILGADVYIDFATDENGKLTGEISLVPSDTFLGIEKANEIDGLYARGSIDYMRMAWLNSNGLLYAIVMLMSVRNYFIYFAGWIGLLMFIEGILRGMVTEEKDREKALIESSFGPDLTPKKKKQKTLVPIMTDKEHKMSDMQKAIVRAIRDGNSEDDDEEPLHI